MSVSSKVDPRAAPAAMRGGPEVERARTLFLVDEPVVPGTVRAPILASWTRSRLWHVRPEHLDLPCEHEADDDSILTRAAEPVLREIADLFATEPLSVILCDADGVVLSRRTGDSALEQHLNRVWLAPGFSYAERFVGTNGIGTALEARGPAQVFGHEHYVERLEELACAGAPIRHPVTGRVLGVMDLTCWQRDAGPMLIATAGTLTHRIEAMLLEQSGERELAVLNDYLVARRRNRGPVLALGEDLLMMNDRARELLDPADQGQLVAEASEALADGRGTRCSSTCRADSSARVFIRPTVSGSGIVGGVLDVQLISPCPRRRRGPPPRPRRSRRRWAPGRPGPSAASAADRHLRTREWVVLEGEPGSGRETVARAAHQRRTPAARLRVLAAEDAGPDCGAGGRGARLSGGSLVLTDVDRCRRRSWSRWPSCWAPTASRPTPAGRGSSPRCVPRRVSPHSELVDLLACFPGTVVVPPLRHHVEDVAELAPHLLARLAHGSTLSISAGGDAGPDPQPVAGQRGPARGRPPQGRGDAPVPAWWSRGICRPSAGRPPADARPPGVDGVRRHRRGAARQPGGARSRPPAGCRCPGRRSIARSATTASPCRPPPSRSAEGGVMGEPPRPRRSAGPSSSGSTWSPSPWPAGRCGSPCSSAGS